MIVEAYRNGISDRYELVEYLNITDRFLDEAIEYYRGKYGLYTQCDGVIVKFEPTFGILDTTII